MKRFQQEHCLITLPPNGITAEVIREIMPSYHRSADLVAATLAALPPPRYDAALAWRQARITRLIQVATSGPETHFDKSGSNPIQSSAGLRPRCRATLRARAAGSAPAWVAGGGYAGRCARSARGAGTAGVAQAKAGV